MYNLFGIRIRIEHQTLNTVFSQFADDIDDFGITDIADVFFESQAKHEHPAASILWQPSIRRHPVGTLSRP